MKNIIFTLIILFGLIDIAVADCTDKSSPYKCKKILIIDDDGNRRIDLNCTLPSPNAKMKITALDVFEADGKTLKTYFGTGETVCDVLGWMNDGAEKFGSFHQSSGVTHSLTQTEK